ncbi:hypothetical protein SCOR_31990 [Sulfidibacter corallicola]|uniref:Uncharacterized protein n=1 Tax=Sulfidibacter corallicola TaxID=2818388 RepID=A0A8A4TJR8_SULCO|nr:hypothetical protein [Sulfidibacter corallicola]QTD49833.1 hypothetical protein J3U87_29985 [Sulfidibacter corallicola]
MIAVIFLVVASYPMREVTVGGFEVKSWPVRNKGSKMTRKLFIVNPEDCPIKIVDAEYRILCTDRSALLIGKFSLKTKTDIHAYRLKLLGFNPFGELISGYYGDKWVFLSSGQQVTEKMTWDDSQNETVIMLVGVVFVERARLADGSIWKIDHGKLVQTISDLNLEKKTEKKKRDELEKRSQVL